MSFSQNPIGIKLSILAAFVISGCISISAVAAVVSSVVGSDQTALSGIDDNVRDVLWTNSGNSGAGNQSIQAGDVLVGTQEADLLVGALGIDVLLGNGGSDILIGGTEAFNPLNRDRGFGGLGEDTFVWAPGDGNDFFDGGEGNDVLILGLIGEERDASGSDVGAPFFDVNPPTTEVSLDLDGIYVNPSSGLPVVNVADGPGFCDVVDGGDSATEQSELTALGLDHLVRFTLRGAAASTTNPDTGLRMAVHLQNTEFLVCGGATVGEIVAMDLRTSPPTQMDVSLLPVQAYALVKQ